MWLKWLPWRLLISRFARSRGFIDPVVLLASLHRFAQPSEVAEPIELLRAGVVFHARGLINTRAIQHNLDWVWPYWVERQFDPADPSFIPRAFSATHINLTHRNWTAVGLPGLDQYPVVDPAGLVTPLFDSWSLDCWVVPEEGPPLLPSRCRDLAQSLRLDRHLAVATRSAGGDLQLETLVDVVNRDEGPCCRLRASARAGRQAWLAIALRPANPEGVSFLHEIEAVSPQRLKVNGRHLIDFSCPPVRLLMSTYRGSDVLQQLPAGEIRTAITCRVGMATAAALFPMGADGSVSVVATVPLTGTHKTAGHGGEAGHLYPAWPEALSSRCSLKVPDGKIRFLYEAAVRTLVLHSPREVFPGPYTYRRFWFRDAAFILEALLALRLPDRVEQCLRLFPERQKGNGYFHSQNGEWDANGEAIWIIQRYASLSGRPLPGDLLRAVAQGAHWICEKRLSDRLDDLHAGLMPAGFSAEHFGPNDFYYWDDFWSAAGLLAAADLLAVSGGPPGQVLYWRREAGLLLAAVDRSLTLSAARRSRGGVPSSPYRRMDSAAVGSLAASYPLRLWQPDDWRLHETTEFLLRTCMVDGGFFQDMIHSGINAYLTLHLAQVLLRAGDRRFADLLQAVARMASPTGQWPEATHPLTGGGCMGDGQHVWAAAEWVLMLRNCFVREEGEKLILASGIPPAWLRPGEELRFGRTLTPYGDLTVIVRPSAGRIRVEWQGRWREKPPVIEVRLPGQAVRAPGPGETAVELSGPEMLD